MLITYDNSFWWMDDCICTFLLFTGRSFRMERRSVYRQEKCNKFTCCSLSVEGLLLIIFPYIWPYALVLLFIRFSAYRVLHWELSVMVLQLHQKGKKVKRTREIIDGALLGSCWFFHFFQSFPLHPKLMAMKQKCWTSELT